MEYAVTGVATILALVLGLLLWYTQYEPTRRPPGPPSRLGLGFILTLSNIAKVHERCVQWFPPDHLLVFSFTDPIVIFPS
jgi:hypothetical protein